MNTAAKQIIVMHQGPDGATRAWATGPKGQLEKVRQRAARQLWTYRQKRASVGDPLATAEFLEVIEDLGQGTEEKA
jgi:hypothetical protein